MAELRSTLSSPELIGASDARSHTHKLHQIRPSSQDPQPDNECQRIALVSRCLRRFPSLDLARGANANHFRLPQPLATRVSQASESRAPSLWSKAKAQDDAWGQCSGFQSLWLPIALASNRSGRLAKPPSRADSGSDPSPRQLPRNSRRGSERAGDRGEQKESEGEKLIGSGKSSVKLIDRRAIVHDRAVKTVESNDNILGLHPSTRGSGPLQDFRNPVSTKGVSGFSKFSKTSQPVPGQGLLARGHASNARAAKFPAGELKRSLG